MTDKKIILGMALIDGYGVLKNAWRAPQVDSGNCAHIEANIRYARVALEGRSTADFIIATLFFCSVEKVADRVQEFMKRVPWICCWYDKNIQQV
ncbi:hypothetical protein [Priestia endophytica]|uniref:hypothetical protein n=1 Tax=Priestia endophytica TaxID=135735 RepID=UPI002282D3CA|nr:hypothetical protein [Priestia endophytica]MCY8231667.1 hypothetical protein [Priestia endophytica]